MPAISVILPVYNANRYLYDAVNSILQQRFTDFELLIVDDGSTESPDSILHAFNDERIHLIKLEENRGISAALNAGIAKAQGRYIARMDADDIASPDRFQEQFEFLEANPDTNLLASWVSLIDEEGVEIRKEWFHPEYYYYNLCFICWIYHPTIMVRTAALREIGGYTETYSEDFELFWQFMRRGKIAVLKKYLLDYRISPESLHNVLKKDEYESRQQLQVKRNMAFYLGRPTLLNDAQVLALRHHFEPLLKVNSVRAVLETLKELKAVTDGMLNCPNPNRVEDDLKKAWYFKQQFMINFYARKMPRSSGVLLLLLTGNSRLLLRLIGGKISLR